MATMGRARPPFLRLFICAQAEDLLKAQTFNLLLAGRLACTIHIRIARPGRRRGTGASFVRLQISHRATSRITRPRAVIRTPRLSISAGHCYEISARLQIAQVTLQSRWRLWSVARLISLRHLSRSIRKWAANSAAPSQGIPVIRATARAWVPQWLAIQ